MSNDTKNPNRFGASDDPFAIDPRFSTGLMGYENAPIAINTSTTVEELENEPDPALAVWGSQLPREVLAGNRAKNQLRQFLENVDDDTLLEAFEKGGVQDPAEREKVRQQIADIKEGKEAEKFLQLRPDYVTDDRNFERMNRYLEAHGLDFTAENLCEAWDALLDGGHVVIDSDAVKPLSESEELRIGRQASGGDVVGALWAYLQCSLPGKTLSEIQSSVPNDPHYSGLVLEAIYFLFRHTQPDYSHDPRFIEFLHTYLDGRPVTLELVRYAWQEYKRQAVLAPQQQADFGAPTEQDIDNLSEAEQERLYNETKKLRVQQLRQRSGY